MSIGSDFLLADKMVKYTAMTDRFLFFSFHATIYPCPENLIDRQDKKDELAKMIQDNITVRCDCLSFLIDLFCNAPSLAVL